MGVCELMTLLSKYSARMTYSRMKNPEYVSNRSFRHIRESGYPG